MRSITLYAKLAGVFLAIRLAFRYFRTRRRGLARFTAFVAVTGIAAGIASLIFVESLARGFAAEMREKILEHTSHIAVSRADGKAIDDWEMQAQRIRALTEVREVAPMAYSNALLMSESDSAYALLRTAVRSDVQTGQANDAFVGKRLAERLGLREGDSAEIVTLEKREPVRIRVAGFKESGIYEFDSSWIELNPSFYALANGREKFSPSILSLKLADIYDVDAVSRKLRAELGADFSVIDWREANEPLFAALSLERQAALAVIFVIVFIAALNITTTLALNAAERRRDIAILKTCGATSGKIAAMFVVEGMILGLIGVAAGLILGVSACAATNYFRLISLPQDVYSIAQITLRTDAGFALLAGASALVLCLVATLFPALRASRAKPADILRSS